MWAISVRILDVFPWPSPQPFEVEELTYMTQTANDGHLGFSDAVHAKTAPHRVRISTLSPPPLTALFRRHSLSFEAVNEGLFSIVVQGRPYASTRYVSRNVRRIISND